ncbi:class I SAM-dependent methyltransferase [Coralloluteibacterium thermophilus]|uniref:Class I SAM-dependent methyltransferase n=1 Tax=Coralloluteibacterium thermophilum TaxID=2707049 RepID=A0ABV9NJ00_9GAMM
MGSPLPVLDAYERWAPDYDFDSNRTRDLDAAVLRAAGLPVEGAAVVEFGAGTGKNSAYLASLARRLTALDLSPAMLARARAKVRGAHVAFVEHDIVRPWPVPDAAADLVVGNLVLEHVADVGPVFRHAARALRPDGILYVCELHPYRQLRGAVARFAAAEGEVRVKAWLHTTADYVTAALAAGFRLVSMAEPRDVPAAGADGENVPRLLQLVFRKDPSAAMPG